MPSLELVYWDIWSIKQIIILNTIKYAISTISLNIQVKQIETLMYNSSSYVIILWW